MFNPIGERLTWARENAGLSQSQAAKMLNSTKTAITQVEEGRLPSSQVAIVAAWCELYDISERWLMFGEEREVVIPDNWPLAQDDRENLQQTLSRMKQKGTEYAIFNGKHLAEMKDVHKQGRVLMARVEYTLNDNTWESAWVNVRSLSAIPEDLSALPENTRLKILLKRANAHIEKLQEYFGTTSPEPTHAYVTTCETCKGICGGLVDDGSEATTEMLTEWASDGRNIALVNLPVKLSCTCPMADDWDENDPQMGPKIVGMEDE